MNTVVLSGGALCERCSAPLGASRHKRLCDPCREHEQDEAIDTEPLPEEE